jgi:glycosyltransferase involved in cell wall biosynthesis
MRIAQVAPLFESVPPRLYGGTERVVSYLTEELVRQGHQVTLFASADSITSAELVPCASRALRLDPGVRDPIPHIMLMLDKVRDCVDEFDILHFHIDYVHFPLFRQQAARTLTTLHGRQDLADHMQFYRRFAQMPLVSISNAQRAPLGRANFVATVHHGLSVDLHKPAVDPRGGYLAFLGRISPEKRPDRAIAIARAAGMPLKIAAKIDKVDEAYFAEVIAPLLKDPGVEFIGEINERAKTDFLGQAAGLIFPIDWPEPFGLVVIEAMACGTPVLAFPCGSVPEIVEDFLTGRIVSSVEEAVQAIPELLALDRRAVRRRFEERFSAARMAADYVRVYRAMLRNRRATRVAVVPPALSPGAAEHRAGAAVAERGARHMEGSNYAAG